MNMKNGCLVLAFSVTGGQGREEGGGEGRGSIVR